MEVAALRQNQPSPVGARVLEGGAEQRVDEVLPHDLAGDRLRDLEDGGELEVFDGRTDRAPRARHRRLVPELRIELIELPHLAIGSPTEVAVPGVSQVEVR